MKDEITINLRALTATARMALETVLDVCLNDIPDEQNEEALEILQKFGEL